MHFWKSIFQALNLLLFAKKFYCGVYKFYYGVEKFNCGNKYFIKATKMFTAVLVHSGSKIGEPCP